MAHSRLADFAVMSLGLDNNILPPIAQTLITLTWKCMWMHLYGVSEGTTPYNPEYVNSHIARRLLTRLRAHEHAATRTVRRQRGSSNPQANIGKSHNRKILPLAHLDEDGVLTLSPSLTAYMTDNKVTLA